MSVVMMMAPAAKSGTRPISNTVKKAARQERPSLRTNSAVTTLSSRDIITAPLRTPNSVWPNAIVVSRIR